MKLTLHHINMAGTDVPALDRFYGEIMLQEEISEMSGLPPVNRETVRNQVAFRTDGHTQLHLAEPDLELAKRHGQTINPLERGHIAYRTDDIAAFKAHLEEKGIPYADYGTAFTTSWHQIFFVDPAGTVIEVHQVLDD